MQSVYDLNAPKKATNLSINSDLLSKSREMDINLSSTLEQALVETLKQRQRAQWLAENRQAIQAYNAEVEETGVFSDGQRSF